MKRLLLLLLLLIPYLCFADIDEWNGVTVTSSVEWCGVSGVASIDGVTVASGGGAGSLYIYPSADGYWDQWTPSGGGDSFDEVYSAGVDDKDNTDDDSTYISTATNNQYDSYTFTDDGGVLTGKTITLVTVYWRSRCESGTPSCRGLVRTNGQSYAPDNEVQSTSYAWFTKSWTLNPQSSSAWTQSEINALEAGVFVPTISGNTVRVTTLYVKVDYE